MWLRERTSTRRGCWWLVWLRRSCSSDIVDEVTGLAARRRHGIQSCVALDALLNKVVELACVIERRSFRRCGRSAPSHLDLLIALEDNRLRGHPRAWSDVNFLELVTLTVTDLGNLSRRCLGLLYPAERQGSGKSGIRGFFIRSQLLLLQRQRQRLIVCCNIDIGLRGFLRLELDVIRNIEQRCRTRLPGFPERGHLFLLLRRRSISASYRL